MADAPNAKSVELATFVLVEMLRSPEASKSFAASWGGNGANSVIAAHQALIEHFQQLPDFDAKKLKAHFDALSS